jgi:hypothetical protein
MVSSKIVILSKLGPLFLLFHKTLFFPYNTYHMIRYYLNVIWCAYLLSLFPPFLPPPLDHTLYDVSLYLAYCPTLDRYLLDIC